MFRKLIALSCAAVALATVAPAPARANGPTLYALVAANATQPFNVLIANFEKSHPGVKIEANYTGTQILEQQLENGAPCDIFLSADLPHAVKLRGEKLISPFRLVSRLHEVVVTPKTDALHITTLRDLVSPHAKLIIGVPDVPIGIYTRTIFEKADRTYGGDFEKKALANVVSFEVNVKQVLQKIVLDEADAGIVYKTDVDPTAAKSVNVVEIPANLNVPASNYIAIATHTTNASLAGDFVAYALSPAGQAIFYRYGYDRK